MGCAASTEDPARNRYAAGGRRLRPRAAPEPVSETAESVCMSDLESMFSEDQMDASVTKKRYTKRPKSPGVPGVEPTREKLEEMIQLKLLAAELRDDTNDAGDGGYAASTVGGRSFPSGRDDEARDDEDEQASGPAEDLAQRPVHLDADNPAPVDKHTARRERRQKRIVESYLAGVDRCDIPPLDTPFLAPLCACTCRCRLGGEDLEHLMGLAEGDAPRGFHAEERFDPRMCCAAHTCDTDRSRAPGAIRNSMTTSLGTPPSLRNAPATLPAATVAVA